MVRGDDPQLRGTVINGYLKFIKKTWGTGGLNRCLKETGLEGERILDGSFYPRAFIFRVLSWISQNHGIDRVRDGGRFAVMNLGPFAYLVRFMKIETMLQKAANGIKETYTYGEPVVHLTGDKRALVEMRDLTPTREDCWAWLGAMEAVMALTKTRGTVKKVSCIHEGAQYCTYELDWN